jgi:nucleolin
VQRRWNSDEASKSNIAEKIELETEKLKVDAESEAAATTTEVEVEVETKTPAAETVSAQEVNEAAIEESAINSVAEGAATTTASASAAADEEELLDSLRNREHYDTGVVRQTRSSPPPESRPARFDRSNVTPRETIYIGNLFFDITAEDLKARMEAFGVVTHCTIVHDSRGLSKG